MNPAQQQQHPGASSYAVPYAGFVGPNAPYPADASPPVRFDGRPDWIPYDAAYPTQNGYAYEPPPPPMYFSPDPAAAVRQPMMAPHPWTQQHYASFRVPHTAPVSPVDERGAPYPNPPWTLPTRHPACPAPLDQAGLRRADGQPTYTLSPTFAPPHSPFDQRVPANAQAHLSVGPPGPSHALQTSRALQQTLDHGPVSLPPPEDLAHMSETDLRVRFSASNLGHGAASERHEPASVPVTRLPSNSHHLLNSPEGRRAAVRQQQQQQLGLGASGHDPEGSEDEDAEGEADESADHQRRVFSSERPSNMGSTGVVTTPAGSPRGRNDAAHVLLSLARSDSSQGAANDHGAYTSHGMALRSGRDVGTSIDDRRVTRSSVSPSRGKPRTGGGGGEDVQQSPPATLQSPMEAKRYHTRSQPEEEPEPQYDAYRRVPTTGLGLPPGMTTHESRSCTASPVDSRPRPHLVHPSAMGHAPMTPQTSGSHPGRFLPSLPALGFGPPMSVSAGSTGTGAATGHQQTTGSRRKGKHRASDSFTATTGTTTTATTTTANGFDDDSRSSYSVSTPGTSVSGPQSSVYFSSRRTFPPQIPIEPSLSRLYRNFPVSSAFGDREPVRSLAAQHGIPLLANPSGAVFNPPAHGHLDLYTPRFTRGVGAEKVGACCICAEPRERGGEDSTVWLKMKVSSYSYHLSFYHGINNVSGLPFSPPVDIRQVKRTRVAANEKSVMREGHCHQCMKWVPLEGVKNSEVKVPELFWWKHAKACHKTRLAGEGNVHGQDDVYDLVARAAGQALVVTYPGVQAGVAIASYQASPSGSVVSHSPGIVQQPIMMPPQPQHQYVYPPPPASSSNPASAYGFNPNAGGSRLPSPALTAASHGSNGSYFVHHHHHHPGGGSSGGTTPKIHPSVGAQRAAAQRAWKRKSDVVDMGLAGGSGSSSSGAAGGQAAESPGGSGSGKRSRRSGPDAIQ